jgi:hypothetical protein
MKTTLKHFKEHLTDDELYKAINNTSNEQLKEKYEAPSLALLGAFIWGKSPEGNKYWGDIHTRILKQKK